MAPQPAPARTFHADADQRRVPLILPLRADDRGGRGALSCLPRARSGPAGPWARAAGPTGVPVTRGCRPARSTRTARGLRGDPQGVRHDAALKGGEQRNEADQGINRISPNGARCGAHVARSCAADRRARGMGRAGVPQVAAAPAAILGCRAHTQTVWSDGIRRMGGRGAAMSNTRRAVSTLCERRPAEHSCPPGVAGA